MPATTRNWELACGRGWLVPGHACENGTAARARVRARVRSRPRGVEAGLARRRADCHSTGRGLPPEWCARRPTHSAPRLASACPEPERSCRTAHLLWATGAVGAGAGLRASTRAQRPGGQRASALRRAPPQASTPKRSGAGTPPASGRCAEQRLRARGGRAETHRARAESTLPARSRPPPPPSPHPLPPLGPAAAPRLRLGEGVR